jgi:hypothetical protein
MLEIRTIIIEATRVARFDNEVNNHLKEGWTLVRRDVLPPYEGEVTCTTQKLYAELERYTEDVESEENEEEETEWAEWQVARDPARPYRCSHCSYKAAVKWSTCPDCGKSMNRVGEVEND